MPKRLIIIGLALCLLAACGGKTQIRPVEELMAEGQAAWDKGKWSKAAEIYGQIRDYYPWHTRSAIARLRAAEALYRDKKYPEALAAFETFEDLYPTHPEMAHILLRIAICHFRQVPSADRDMTEAEAAVKAFSRVTEAYPGSPQAKEAEEYLTQTYRVIIQHEIHVAEYYRKTKAYEAAAGRYHRALSYPEVGYGPTLAAELAIVEALAKGEKPPKIKVPEPDVPQEGWLERLEIWK